MSTDRIAAALEIANDFAGNDGDHHKTYCIDQMVRALTACPVVSTSVPVGPDAVASAETQGKSDAYERWVAAHKFGDDGPETYGWDEGIAP